MQSKPYDVVLLPEKRLRDDAIAERARMQSRGSLFVLGHETFVPHVSLYMLQLSDDGLKNACTLLAQIAARQSAITLNASTYHYENDYVDVEYVRTAEIVDLQVEILSMLNPIRDGLREKDRARLVDATGETRTNLLQFGYRSVGALFSPHLTFAKFADPQGDVVQALPSCEEFSGVYGSLGIFAMGDNGTCARRVMSWNLPSALR